MSLYRTKLLKGILGAKPKGPALYFEMRAISEFRVTPKFTAPGVVLKYSINAGQTWHEISSGETTPYTPTSIRFIGVSPSGSLFTSSNSSNAWGVQFSDPSISPTNHAELSLAGNMMALVMDTFEDTTLKTAVGAYAFASMFFNMELLQYIETETLLPATTLATRCYQNMFYGCSNNLFISAPALPATTLATECYSRMFYGCTNLTNAPDLPATTLATSCYQYMFQGCSELTSITLHYTGVDTSYFTGWIKLITTTGTLYKAGTQFSAPSNDTYPATWTQVQI